tara:strand:+ start:3046 stop:3165 length:120 start_codon:yes stop_codon:yes gene_type:complete
MENLKEIIKAIKKKQKSFKGTTMEHFFLEDLMQFIKDYK